MIQQMSQQASRPPGMPPSMPPAAGGTVSLAVLPAVSNQAVGSTFQAAILLNGGQDISSVPIQLQYDPKVLQLVSVDAGAFLSGDGQAVALVHHEEGNGLVSIDASRPPNAKGMNGQGSLCTVTFKAISPGDTNLALVKVAARNSAQQNLPTVGSQSVVHVK
jgi:general secretion pathway protein D